MELERKKEMFGDKVNFDALTRESFLLGLINEFNNRFQTVGDRFFREISWKQEFTLRCITFFEEPPTIKDLAEFLGTSHQNAKQVLSKLEAGSFIKMVPDKLDRRKQRIITTERAEEIVKKYEKPAAEMMRKLFAGIDSDDLDTTIKVILQLQYWLKNYQEEMK